MAPPVPSWLLLKWAGESERPDPAELRAQAAAAIAQLDAAVARNSGPTPSSRCGRCRAPIPATATTCTTCGVNYLADAAEMRAAADARQYGLSKVYMRDGFPVEFSHHDGAVLEVR